MELKEMILSTLAELDEVSKKETQSNEVRTPTNTIASFHEERIYREESVHVKEEVEELEEESAPVDDQKQFFLNLRERILVLFEGFQSPNNKNIEAKIDLTLNFLEYLLATIDEHLESMDKSKHESASH
ncbi:MAG: hypothetical protein PHN18_05375 [Sulfurospirillaceae bacterium]|nr:hypothetical protein [Sulfurospirillaceae bacterium]MDD2825740.1 hypothetical protein [Sulfurospirillaceae bacterium]